MAEGCVNKAAAVGRLARRSCVTQELQLHGYDANLNQADPFGVYGADARELRKLIQVNPALAIPLHPALPYCGVEVVWAVRSEMARTAADVLVRRTRALLLNARAAVEMAPRVAELMAHELRRGGRWITEQVSAFSELATGYT
jgi:glycerol-3-phosphate dehydrogenase